MGGAGFDRYRMVSHGVALSRVMVWSLGSRPIVVAVVVIYSSGTSSIDDRLSCLRERRTPVPLLLPEDEIVGRCVGSAGCGCDGDRLRSDADDEGDADADDGEDDELYRMYGPSSSSGMLAASASQLFCFCTQTQFTISTQCKRKHRVRDNSPVRPGPRRGCGCTPAPRPGCARSSW